MQHRYTKWHRRDKSRHRNIWRQMKCGYSRIACRFYWKRHRKIPVDGYAPPTGRNTIRWDYW